MDRIRSLYAGEVSFNDQSFGALLDHLKTRNLAAETIVALTSDHGEEFWEHGRRGHGHALFDESIRVPLIVRQPGRVPAGRRVSTPVAASVDLAPTLLALAGMPIPEGMDGRALAPENLATESIHSRLRLGERRLEAIRREPWKLILDVEAQHASLFDVAADRAERTDRSRDEVATAKELANDLDARLGAADRRRRKLLGGDRPSAVSADELPEKSREALKALGYVN